MPVPEKSEAWDPAPMEGATEIDKLEALFTAGLAGRTVREIREVEWDPDNSGLLIAAEKAGKNRRTVIKFFERM